MPLEVAVLGTGFIADYHLEILSKLEGVQVVAACDLNESRLREFTKRWGIARAETSLERLLSEDSPDVVHILAPPNLHYQLTKQVLESGVHVLLEKPIALSIEQAQHLADLAKRQNVSLGVNHNWLHQPLFERAVQEIEQRKIGPTRHVTSTNSLPLFQLQAGLHDHWMFAEPTNILFEQATHPLSQVCRLIGDVDQVKASWGNQVTLRGGVPFYTDWQFELSGAQGNAQVLLTFGSVFPDAQLHILGQDGAISIDQLNHLYHRDQRTRLIDAGDRFVRGLRRSWSSAVDACRGLAGYGLSLMRLTERKDVYYLGMKTSVKSFYQHLRARNGADPGLANALQTTAVLQQVVDQFEQQSPLTTAQMASEATDQSMKPVLSDKGKVLVIGAGGFIGRKVVELFAQAGGDLRLMVRSPKRIADLTAKYDLDVVAGDITNPDDVDRAMDGCETVIHLVAGAPETWEGFERLFIGGLENVANAALKHRVKRLLYASSITALYLGKASEVITSDTPVDPYFEKRCDYARAKILSEALLDRMHREQNLPVVVFRPGIVIGQGSPPQHLGIGEWPSKTKCVRWGRDTQSEMPLVLAEDVAQAFLKAVIAEPENVIGKSFNLVGDVRLSADEYIQVLRNGSQRDFQLIKQAVSSWAGLEWFKWSIKALARKPENSRMTRREVAYRTGAAKFDCSEEKQALDWQPESNRQAFIQRGILDAMRGITDQ